MSENDIDSLLQAKEKELKEVQSLKFKALEQKIVEKSQQLLYLEAKAKDFSMVLSAKDLEIRELHEISAKNKRILAENSLKNAAFQAELERKTSEIQEKNLKISDFCEKIDENTKEIAFLKRNSQECAKEKSAEIMFFQEIQRKIERSERDLKKELEASVSEAETLRKGLGRLEEDSARKKCEFLQEKQVFQEKIENLLKENNQLRENHEIFKKTQEKVAEKVAEKKKKLRKIKEKMEESEFLLKKTLAENEASYSRMKENLAKKTKELGKALEISEIQRKNASDEKIMIFEKFAEIKEKLEICEKNHKNLQSSFEEKKRLLLEKTQEIEKIARALQETERKSRIYQQKAEELDQENQLLIQEVASFRTRNHLQEGNGIKAQKIPISRQIFEIEDLSAEKDENSDKKYHKG